MRLVSPVVSLCALVLVVAALAGATDRQSDPPLDYWPQWSPDGRRLLFERDGTPVLMNMRDRSLRRLPGSLPADVARDGRIVLLERDPLGADLLVVRPNGSGSRLVTRGRGDDTSPHW
ncbi:MAG: hypothetical protein M3321_09455 [Actinomycetota bacterium]|nr:hypothetical protein [Actinomycetota bacterium]